MKYSELIEDKDIEKKSFPRDNSKNQVKHIEHKSLSNEHLKSIELEKPLYQKSVEKYIKFNLFVWAILILNGSYCLWKFKDHHLGFNDAYNFLLIFTFKIVGLIMIIVLIYVFVQILRMIFCCKMAVANEISGYLPTVFILMLAIILMTQVLIGLFAIQSSYKIPMIILIQIQAEALHSFFLFFSVCYNCLFTPPLVTNHIDIPQMLNTMSNDQVESIKIEIYQADFLNGLKDSKLYKEKASKRRQP